MNDQASTLNDETIDPAARGTGHQPALTGCPWHDVNEMLQAAGLRPTRQRMALGWLLFGKGARHLTAEMLYEEATLAKVPVSLATVYNTLNQLTDAGLLRQVSVDGPAGIAADDGETGEQQQDGDQDGQPDQIQRTVDPGRPALHDLHLRWRWAGLLAGLVVAGLLLAWADSTV